MRPFLVAFLVFTFGKAATAQQPIPVFRSKHDSLRFEELRTLYIEAAKDPRNTRKSDSLRLLQADLVTSGALRYRPSYKPDPSYTNYDDLGRQENLSSAKKISLAGYKGKKLPGRIYLCSNLEELELVNTHIQKIPRQLGSLKKLKVLTVLNNNPEKKLVLSGNKGIEELVIHGDEHHRLPRSYQKFRNLKTLDLSRNSLTDFPNVKRCKSLSKLILTYNRLTLTDLKGNVNVNLEELNLGGNIIKVVPSEISHFTGLKKLNFNNNQVEQVRPGIENLPRLEELSFYQNKLSRIPDPVYSMNNLRVIDLYFNQIERVEPKLSQMKNLRILYLSNNKLYSLPDDMGELLNLRELYLHHNRLSNLPESIGNLSQLTVLRINHNNLLELPSSIIKLTALENFDFSHNQIESFPTHLFPFSRLHILALVGNPWDNPTREMLPEWAKNLRSNHTIVHLNTYEDEVENP